MVQISEIVGIKVRALIDAFISGGTSQTPSSELLPFSATRYGLS